jgi:hypothetical protein
VRSSEGELEPFEFDGVAVQWDLPLISHVDKDYGSSTALQGRVQIFR